jgi:hypothetical protein
MHVSPMLGMLGTMEVAVLLLGMGIVPYFVPTIVAAARQRPNTGAIFALNLLLGWTFVGWIVALVWALVNDKPPVIVVLPPGSTVDDARQVLPP